MRCFEDGTVKPGGEKVSSFLEAAARVQIERETEYWLTYGTSGETIDRSSGKVIYHGPGIFEFLEQGNVRRYSIDGGSIDMIAEQMAALWFDRVPIGERNVVLYTGQAGLQLFHEWVDRKFGQTAVVKTVDFVLSDEKPFEAGRNGKGLQGYQFTKYFLPVFGQISVAHWPILDNTRINGAMAPGSIYPLSSYEFFAFNVGFGEPNIALLRRKGSRFQGYRVGYWTPMGPVGPGNPMQATMDGLYYKWKYGDEVGIALFDTSMTLWFKPNYAY